MAIKIRTENPTELLSKIYAEIDNKKIKTWSYKIIHEKFYFSHITSDSQWVGQAWLTAKVEGDILTFNIIKPKNKSISSIAYAVYHGRFTEMLLSHFDSHFSIVWSTALPAKGDITS